jgi:RNA polymerase sigma-70 factor (ECF subfamily)
MGGVAGRWWASDVTDGAAPPARGDVRSNTALDAAMDRYAGGEDAAFGDLYDLLAPRLYGFLVRQTRSAATAEDLVQQTFLNMHSARASYVTGAHVLPWAFAIARRLVIDGHRRRRDEVSFDADDGPADLRISGEVGPDEALQVKQTAARVEAALASLPEGQRAAFELVKRDGLSVAEAAEVLGVSVGALKVRAHRTYEAIRAAIRDEDEAPLRGVA